MGERVRVRTSQLNNRNQRIERARAGLPSALEMYTHLTSLKAARHTVVRVFILFYWFVFVYTTANIYCRLTGMQLASGALVWFSFITRTCNGQSYG